MRCADDPKLGKYMVILPAAGLLGVGSSASERVAAGSGGPLPALPLMLKKEHVQRVGADPAGEGAGDFWSRFERGASE